MLHAAQCRTTHVHVVVTCTDASPQIVIREFKAWCSRRLNHMLQDPTRQRWWSQGGSARLVFGERSLANVITYVRECQDMQR
ncbi:MAG: hypothetical protein KJS77_04865 [Planctomycetes bacterium]|nr:hypothetical protein [Planctomycetota bacterium]